MRIIYSIFYILYANSYLFNRICILNSKLYSLLLIIYDVNYKYFFQLLINMFLKKLNQIASNQSGARANVMYGNILDQERYFKLLSYVKNKDILDCACGIGWGSYLIANVGANHVTSVDLSEEAISAAKNYFNHPNINFVNE